MSRELIINTNLIKTYKTKDNARAAIAKKGFEEIRHIITQADNGRYYPIFLGQDAASAGVHFHFCIA